MVDELLYQSEQLENHILFDLRFNLMPSLSFTMDLTTRQTFWNMILGNFVIMTWNICFDQKSVQRILALPSLMHSRRSLILFAIGMCFIVSLTCFTGIIMYAYYYQCDPVRKKVNSVRFRNGEKFFPQKLITFICYRLSAMETK